MRRVGKVGVMVKCVRERGVRVGSTGRVVKPGTCKESGGRGGLIGMHNTFDVLEGLCVR